MAKISNEVFFVMKRAGRMAFDHGMLRDGCRALVAVSGGASSSALLRVLHVRMPRTPIRYTLVPVHVQDGLHGDESEVTSQLESDCQAIGLSLISVPGEAAEAAGSFPHRTTLMRLAQEQQCGVVLLGHHLVDAAATVWQGLVAQRQVVTLPMLQPLGEDFPQAVGRPLLDLLPEPMQVLCEAEGLSRFDRFVPADNQQMVELLRNHARSANGNEVERLRNLRDAPTHVKDEYLV